MEDVEISPIVGINSSRKKSKTGKKKKREDSLVRRKHSGTTERTIIPGEKIEVTPETWTKILQKEKKNSKQRKKNFREKIVLRT